MNRVRAAALAWCAATVASFTGLPFAARAQAPAGARDSVATVEVAPGVTWRRVVRAAGPWVVNVVSIDLKRGDYELRHVRALDSLRGREKVTSMAARAPEGADRVVAAINADFFNVQTGESENNQVIDGEWWKGLRGTDSPFDAFDNLRTQFGVDARGRPLLDRFALYGTVLHARSIFPVTGVNYFPRTAGEAVVLYTPRFGKTPADTVRLQAEVPLRNAARRGDTLLFVQSGVKLRAGDNPIPSDGAILAAYGPRSTTVAAFAEGDTVRVLLLAAGDRGDGPTVAPRLLIGGWPRILQNGRDVAVRAPWSEGTISSNAEARHPRSAVGFSRDSSTLILATVDGRQASSVGVTIVELARLMLDFGAWDALNFDGGGSTALAIKGRVVNSPSDPAGERAVANALMVVRRVR